MAPGTVIMLLYIHLGLDVSSSTHNCGCVVNGGNAIAAI